MPFVQYVVQSFARYTARYTSLQNCASAPGWELYAQSAHHRGLQSENGNNSVSSVYKRDTGDHFFVFGLLPNMDRMLMRPTVANEMK